MNAVLSTPTPMTDSVADVHGQASDIDILSRLEDICAGRGLNNLAARLHELIAFVGTDLQSLELEIAALPKHQNLAGKGATHLLARGGKRLRPMCTALAARVGSGWSAEVLDLAVAAELVHNATLLHDDVVDLADTRRGDPTARTIYGNAASIFAGDWVLIEALRRVQRTGLPGVMESLLSTIEEMIFAESLQLQNRDRINTQREVYFRVVRGKTASVFHWGMAAGAQAGGLEPAEIEALGDYGMHLGMAFQATDDLLDLTGDPENTGKELFTDLREGKMTFPLILALERDETLQQVIEGILAEPVDAPMPADSAKRVIDSLRKTEAVDDCLKFAREQSAEAVARLQEVPQGRATEALATVAEAIVNRDL